LLGDLWKGLREARDFDLAEESAEQYNITPVCMFECVLSAALQTAGAYDPRAEVLRYMPYNTRSAGRLLADYEAAAAAAAETMGSNRVSSDSQGFEAAARRASTIIEERERAEFVEMLGGVDAQFEAFEPSSTSRAAGDSTRTDHEEDGDAAYAEALYHCPYVAEARRRAAWEVQIAQEMAEATLCVTERACPICLETLGDDSNGTVCQLACGGGTHYFHARCIGPGVDSSW